MFVKDIQFEYRRQEIHLLLKHTMSRHFSDNELFNIKNITICNKWLKLTINSIETHETHAMNRSISHYFLIFHKLCPLETTPLKTYYIWNTETPQEFTKNNIISSLGQSIGTNDRKCLLFQT